MVLTCSFCFLNNDVNGDREFIYMVFYPDFKGYVCHECNKMLSANHDKQNVIIEEEKELELSDCF